MYRNLATRSALAESSTRTHPCLRQTTGGCAALIRPTTAGDAVQAPRTQALGRRRVHKRSACTAGSRPHRYSQDGQAIPSATGASRSCDKQPADALRLSALRPQATPCRHRGPRPLGAVGYISAAHVPQARDHIGTRRTAKRFHRLLEQAARVTSSRWMRCADPPYDRGRRQAMNAATDPSPHPQHARPLEVQAAAAGEVVEGLGFAGAG